MIIKSIKLVNFRNHTEYQLNCKDETTVISGKNGCGKTSVLEAIYIMTRGKSFRATDPEILKRGKEFYRLEIEYQNGENLVATFDGQNKTFTILDKKTRRLPKKHKYPVVLFLPSDLNLIHNSPSRRRDYFNRVFGDFDEKYSSLITKYDKALRQRNELLKNENITKEALFSWNLLLAQYGTKIYNYRQDFLAAINQKLTATYQSIAKNKDEISIVYQTEITSNSTEQYLKHLEQNFQKELYLGHTSFGIHRDDFIFMFNKKPAEGSASRGETRSIILALKFNEAELIYQKQNQKPIILLDDVFSELDQTRRKCLVKNFKDNQVIITSVESI